MMHNKYKNTFHTLSRKLFIYSCYTASALGAMDISAMETAVTASSEQNSTNSAIRVTDGDPETRWSAQGNGEWISFDLGSNQEVDSVNIAFYRGDTRLADIEIQVSIDNSNWTTLFSGTQPDYSLDLQAFELSSTIARYVRIVGHGNSSNNWNSLTEVSIESAATEQDKAVTLYQHCNYNGYAIELAPGSYSLDQLIALGVKNNDVSSIDIEDGYEVTLYDQSFSGNTLYKANDDSCLVDDGFNDRLSSVTISPVSPTPVITPVPIVTPAPVITPIPTPAPIITPVPVITPSPTGGPEITSVPANLPNVVSGLTAVNDLYDPVKYLYVEEFDMHILATEGVTDWTVLGAREMAVNMVRSIQAQSDRDKFKNHHFFVITEEDPDVPGAIRTGHKNTGNAQYTVFTQDNICSIHAGSFNPTATPVWRAWNTPVHEFGHAIELALGKRNTTISTYEANTTWAVNSNGAEFFAWGMQAWFNANISKEGDDYRESLPAYQQEYYGSIFDISDVWTPSCEGKPE